MAKKFVYSLKNGKTLELEGDEQPSDEEVESIAHEQKVELTPVDVPVKQETKIVKNQPDPIENPTVKEVQTPDKQQSTLSKAWHKVSDPLTDAPSRFARSVGQSITEPHLDESPLWAGVKGFGAGALEGIGDLASSMTSPLNLATMAATSGSSLATKSGLSGAARGLNLVGRGLSAPVAVHGGMQVLDPKTSLSEKGFGLAELAGGIAGMTHGIPRETGLNKVSKSIESGETANNVEFPKSKPKYRFDNKTKKLIKVEETEIPVNLPPDLVPVGDEAKFNENQPLQPNTLTPEEALYKHASERFNMGIPMEETVTSQESINPVLDVMNDENGIQSVTNESEIPPSMEEIPESFKPFTEPLTPEQTKFPSQLPPNNTPKSDSEQIPNAMRKISQTIPSVAKMAPAKEKQNIIREALNAQRTLLTSYDLSAPGRQGLPLIGRKEWWTSLDDMFKAWGSEKAFQTIQDSIVDHPSGYFKGGVAANGKPAPSFAQKAGLELTDLLSNNEEVFRSKIAEKLPGIKASNRAFVGYLNKLRSDTFANMVDSAKKAGKDPENDLVLAKQISDFINNATGRGSLGKLEPVAKTMSDVFFAPRLMASRIKTYTNVLNPKTYNTLDPQVRRETLKSVLALAGVGTTMGQLARLAGAEVNGDPTNTDFGKIKIGNTRLDPFGGHQQYLVGAAKLLSGKSTSSTSGRVTDLTRGKFGQQTRASVVSNFFKNKLAPVPSMVWSWMEGREFDGTPFEVKKALLSRTIPIIMQDLQSLAEEDPRLLPLIIPSSLGMGMQTYGPR